MRYKKGDIIRIVNWFGGSKEAYNGCTGEIEEITNETDTYPYHTLINLKNGGLLVGLCDDEIVYDKEYQVKQLLEEVDKL